MRECELKRERIFCTFPCSAGKRGDGDDFARDSPHHQAGEFEPPRSLVTVGMDPVPAMADAICCAQFIRALRISKVAPWARTSSRLPGLAVRTQLDVERPGAPILMCHVPDFFSDCSGLDEERCVLSQTGTCGSMALSLTSSPATLRRHRPCRRSAWSASSRSAPLRARSWYA